ncbi:hypothetical protein SAMN05443247_06976 [Bradyrhizobium erythrophlei]|nr:hypothetical protein SAMN05443247_06976 [Bradyrhizobium erythrophlei]
MKFEMTKCNQCGSEMLMGVTICPSCGKPQTGLGKPGGLYTPGTMLAVGLAAAVLLFFMDQVPRAAGEPVTSISNPSCSMTTAKNPPWCEPGVLFASAFPGCCAARRICGGVRC